MTNQVISGRSSQIRQAVGAALFAASVLFFCARTFAASEPDVRRDAAVTAIDKVLPSVVNIATETVIEYHEWYDDLLRQFYGWPRTAPRTQKSVSLGSGVIIDEDGYILTNFHVVRRASRIQVKLWDGHEYDAEPRVATTGSDVALLKLKCKPGEKFRAIKFAADDDLLLGETVLALGNPYGLGGSVTKGILSSKNRRPSNPNTPLNVEDWLQTDAAINPGNSGGPLVNLRGELIGLNVAVYREERGERGLGVSFSIPVKQVSAALSRFFTPEVTDSLCFGVQVKAGAGLLTVSAVQPGGPAANAGLREGDQILQVNGTVPSGLISFNQLVVVSPNRTAKLVVGRRADKVQLTVRLVPVQDAIRQKLGLGLAELGREDADRLGMSPGQGLLIQEIEKGGPADRAQIQRGYILTAIDGQAVNALRTAADMLQAKKAGELAGLNLIVPRRIGGSYLELRQATADLTVR